MRRSGERIVMRNNVVVLMMLIFSTTLAWPQSKLSVHWEELAALIFEGLERSQGTCVLPFGILEKHGAHLPLGTDLLDVRHAALHAAERDTRSSFPNIIWTDF